MGRLPHPVRPLAQVIDRGSAQKLCLACSEAFHTFDACAAHVLYSCTAVEPSARQSLRAEYARRKLDLPARPAAQRERRLQ